MSEEFNNLTFDNTKVTFTGTTNNIATSDELEAAYLYQDKMGTNYSKSKTAVRAFNFVGISLILTAAALKTGNIISNAFAPTKPTVSEFAPLVEDDTFKATFVISNPSKLDVFYYLTVNGEDSEKVDCSEEKTYDVEYSHLQVNDECTFYVKYSKTVVYTYEFKVEV